ncbi:MAG: GTP cyclohydrolase I [Candidatus Caldarchaeum sp.]
MMDDLVSSLEGFLKKRCNPGQWDPATPMRFVQALLDLTQGYGLDLELDALAKSFEHSSQDSLVIVRGIRFYSLCAHHILPFFGTVSIGYIPNGKVLGLSKFPRLVSVLSKRLLLQESLAKDIADWLEEHLKPRGVGVIIRSVHLCMQMRGIEDVTAEVITSEVRGDLRHEPEARAEFLNLMQG